MPVRLLKPYDGQAANTLFWSSDRTQEHLIALGIADAQTTLASNYGETARRITAATATTSRNAEVYHMNSATDQTLTVNLAGLPQDTAITIVQEGAGKTTLVAATGTTINTAASSLITSGQYSLAQVIVTSPNTGVAFGGIGSAVATPTVTITGTQRVDQTLTATPANISGISSRQWYRSGFGLIPGATSSTYLLTVNDIGWSVYQTVVHSTGSTSSATVGPIAMKDLDFYAKSNYVYLMNASKGSEVIDAGGTYLDTMTFDQSLVPTGDVTLSSFWSPTVVPGGGVFCYNYLDLGDYFGSGYVPTPIASRQVSGLSAGQCITQTNWSQQSGNGNFNILEETWLTTTPNVRTATLREVGFFYNAPVETINLHLAQVAVGTYTDQVGQQWSCTVGGTYWTFLKLGATTPAQAILNASTRDWGHVMVWLRGQDASFAPFYLNGAAVGEEVTAGGGARTHLLRYQKVAWS